MPAEGAKVTNTPLDPENSLLLMRAHMNQYVAGPEDISDTSNLGCGTVISGTTATIHSLTILANFRFFHGDPIRDFAVLVIKLAQDQIWERGERWSQIRLELPLE